MKLLFSNLWQRKRGVFYVKADPTRGGDLGNYWHYLLGFLFPLVIWLRINQPRSSSFHLVIDACNPLMDKHLESFLHFRGYSFEFQNLTSKDLQTKNDYGKTKYRIITNLLQVIERKILGRRSRFFIYHQFKRKLNTLKLPRWDEYLQQYEELPPTMEKYLHLLKNELFDFAELTAPSEPKTILFIQRSAPSQINQVPDGNKARWFEGYGTARRHLLGIEETVSEAKNYGIHAEIIEPGANSFKEQIQQFANAKGMIGVRGAEFINMMWLKEGSLVLMVESAGFKTKALQPVLAKALNLKFYCLDHQGLDSPKIDFTRISKYLGTKITHLEVTN